MAYIEVGFEPTNSDLAMELLRYHKRQLPLLGVDNKHCPLFVHLQHILYMYMYMCIYTVLQTLKFVKVISRQDHVLGRM